MNPSLQTAHRRVSSVLGQLLSSLLPRERTIAVFGGARLVQNRTGRITLCAGTVDDRRAVQEWCSHFLHEAIVDVERPDLHLAVA